MALIPDKLDQLTNQKDLLISKENYIEKKIEGNNDIKIENELISLDELNGMNKEQLEEKLKNIELEINECNNGINIEKMKMNKYKEENEKRQHNYVPIIFEISNYININLKGMNWSSSPSKFRIGSYVFSLLSLSTFFL